MRSRLEKRNENKEQQLYSIQERKDIALTENDQSDLHKHGKTDVKVVVMTMMTLILIREKILAGNEIEPETK